MQSNYTGAGIGVALIDSGVSNHADLYTGILPFLASGVSTILRARKFQCQ